MATLMMLAQRGGPLRYVKPPEPKRGTERELYVTHPFTSWCAGDLQKIAATTWSGSVPTRDQVRDIFNRYMRGDPLIYEGEYRDLDPTDKGVWEFKTGDVRIFGWFHAFNVFVATNGADKNWLVEDTDARYAMHIDRCTLQRGGLDLDEPKFIPSQDHRYVISS